VAVKGRTYAAVALGRNMGGMVRRVKDKMVRCTKKIYPKKYKSKN